MWYNRHQGWVVLGLLSVLLALAGQSVLGAAAASSNPVTTRIKDIARLQGIRNNQLNGVGIVVGLNGTGDSSKANVQMAANALSKWGLAISVADLKVKNIAAVILTATLTPFMHQGDALNVQVASFGDAKSLQGGILLQAPLSSTDGKVYVVAQGPVYMGDTKQTADKNVATVGIVPSGGIVEREIPLQYQFDNKIFWALNYPDFTTATRLAQTINNNIAAGVARAVDMGMVEVKLPFDRTADPIAFIAEMETLPVTPDGLAKVVVNERTGTVVVGENVRLAPVAVTHNNITVKVSRGAAASGDGKKGGPPEEEDGRLIMLPEGTSIGVIVRALNKVGTDPADIVAVLVALKNAGALYGVLEFM
jgi:flagellar P-ring protein precursor FlgI